MGEARQVLVDANAIPHIVQARPETIPDQVWLANKIYTSTIHPDTGEKIPQPFRMSGFALYGSPIVVGMLLPNPTGSIGQIVFWQWVHILTRLFPSLGVLRQFHSGCFSPTRMRRMGLRYP